MCVCVCVCVCVCAPLQHSASAVIISAGVLTPALICWSPVILSAFTLVLKNILLFHLRQTARRLSRVQTRAVTSMRIDLAAGVISSSTDTYWCLWRLPSVVLQKAGFDLQCYSSCQSHEACGLNWLTRLMWRKHARVCSTSSYTPVF